MRPTLFCVSVAPINATALGFNIASSLDLWWSMRRRKGLATGDVLILGDSIYLLASNGLPSVVQRSANVGQERLTVNMPTAARDRPVANHERQPKER